MITSFSVKPDTFVEDILFFASADFNSFDSHVIPLFGPNGVGKSTLIKAFEDQKVNISTDKPTKFFSYQNSRDNFKHREARSYHESFEPWFIKGRLDAQIISEGQSIIYSFFDLLDCFKDYESLPILESQDYLLLLDEIDSGMSIDNIDTAMRKIKYLLRVRNDLQIIMSFNSPRVLKWFPDVLSMYDGTKITLHTDEDMIKEIRKHKVEFDKSRKDSKGRPKVAK